MNVSYLPQVHPELLWDLPSLTQLLQYVHVFMRGESSLQCILSNSERPRGVHAGCERLNSRFCVILCDDLTLHIIFASFIPQEFVYLSQKLIFRLISHSDLWRAFIGISGMTFEPAVIHLPRRRNGQVPNRSVRVRDCARERAATVVMTKVIQNTMVGIN